MTSPFGNTIRLMPISHDGTHYIASVPIDNIHASTVSAYGELHIKQVASEEMLAKIAHHLSTDTWTARRVIAPQKTANLSDLAA